MGKFKCHISVSLDGCVAGPNQSIENPLGIGGRQLHEWVVSLATWRQSHGMEGGEVNESTRVVRESGMNLGAGVMGRNMFGPSGGGPWGAVGRPLQLWSPRGLGTIRVGRRACWSQPTR